MAPTTNYNNFQSFGEYNMRKVRCKMVVDSVKPSYEGSVSQTVRLNTRYDNSIPEDQRFFDATPYGHVEMLVNNPAALAVLTPGKEFYMDFIPVDNG